MPRSWAQQRAPHFLAFKVDKRVPGEGLRVTGAGAVVSYNNGEAVAFATYQEAAETFYVK